METVTLETRKYPSDSRYSRMDNAREAAIAMGWTPLTEEEELEFNQMIAEITNL